MVAYKKERGWGSEERVGEGRLLIGGVHWKLEAVGPKNPRLSMQHKFIQLTTRRLIYELSQLFIGRKNTQGV